MFSHIGNRLEDIIITVDIGGARGVGYDLGHDERVPGITHFEMYINEAFEISSNAAADWFREHLGLEPKKMAEK